MKKISVLGVAIVTFLLLVSFASASQVNILPAEENSNHIFFDETATYQMTITNTGDTDMVYVWETNPVEWLIDSRTSATVLAGEQKTVEILLRPRPSNYRGPGFYVVPITVSSQDEVISSMVTVRIINPDAVGFEYPPSVALGASIGSVNPSEIVSVQLAVRNRNRLDMEELTIRIDGEHFQTTDVISLDGLEEQSLEYRFDVDKALEPGSYELSVDIVYEDKVITSVERFYDVIAYSTIDRQSDESTKYFKTTTVNTLTNYGNINKEVKMAVPIKWYQALFTVVDVEASTVDKSSRGSYVISLAPQEVATVTVIRNYQALPLLALLALLVVLSYFAFRSPIVLHKQTIVTGKDKEGISEMRVRIFVRNRTGKPYYNVRILDQAPAIAEVHAASGLGVIAPSKIVHTHKKGTIIKWDFENLEAYEERIVTYTVKAKLKIIGHLGLPPVKAKFENQKGRQRTTKSGKAVIGSR